MAKHQQLLSPEKYIQTKVRSLQIGDCFVNRDWETTKLASVVVQRQHDKGNITAGIYLVDLLCRGIKDTFYLFNQSQYEIEDHFDFESSGIWQKIDYDLAHNIVYAGHDFAADYHIEPHKLFSITKYILEEDNDDMPLIEIETGDDKGNPYLVVNSTENYTDILKKLKQCAGEGNYTFVIANDDDDNEFEEEDIDENDDPDITEIEEGFLDFNHVTEISTNGLLQIISNKERSLREEIIIQSELLIRLYNKEVNSIIIEDYYDILQSADYSIYEKGKDQWLEANERARPVFREILNDLKQLIKKDTLSPVFKDEYLRMVDKYEKNDLGILALLQTTPLPITIQFYESLLENYNRISPAGQLFIAASGFLLGKKSHEQFTPLLMARNVEDAYQADMRIHGLHHKFFWFVKAAQALMEDNGDNLWHWHNLISVVGIGGNIKFLYAFMLKNQLEKKLNINTDDEHTATNYEDVFV